MPDQIQENILKIVLLALLVLLEKKQYEFKCCGCLEKLADR